MMHKVFASISLVLLAVTTSFGQEFGFGITQEKLDPVTWEGTVEDVSENEFILHYQATVEDGWYIYAQESPAGIPFNFEFLQKDKGITRAALARESKTKVAYDSIFEEDVIKYEGQRPKLSMPITITDSNIKVVQSIIKYQVCKTVCIPQEFYIAHHIDTQTAKVFTDFNEFEAYAASENQKNASLAAERQAEITAQNDTSSNWTVFILSFLGGLAALLTPCVFPMIPMTVSYFTKQSTSRAQGIKNASIYGLSIIVIYVVIGLVVSTIFGPWVIVEISTSVTFNLIFFLLLAVFAISFFGAFEIMLPQRWANKIDRQADRGGLVGIFFMALALAIVSFSCTGPIVGTALVQSVLEGGITPVISMLGFSSAIALPFALFALFPSWLNSLPKSGGWLNTVKVVLGFLELALAFKFLSNADLVSQSHLLEREVFLALIIAIMLGLTLYLFGKIKLPHDSDLNHISVGRLVLGLLTLSFVVYMIPGLWGAPLKIISGFPPPMHYSESPYGIGGTASIEEGGLPEGAELGPHDIISFTDYEAGLAFAKAENKPILLDFTGLACINCRRMEERVWSDPKILSILKNDIVLISLYGDSREELPKDEQTISEGGRRIKTVGNKWSDFQITRYNILAAPYYVLMDHEEKNLNKPVAYTPDIKVYHKWLKEGISNFK